MRRFRSLLADLGRPGAPALPGFGRKERDRFAQRYRIDPILVGQRSVDSTVFHIRAVAASMQFHGLLCGHRKHPLHKAKQNAADKERRRNEGVLSTAAIEY